MSDVVRLRVRISGRVQDVGFRWRAQQEAVSLDLTGWVRNAADGSVEVEAQGAHAAVDELLEWLRHGPPWATVAGIESEQIPPRVGEQGFAIAR